MTLGRIWHACSLQVEPCRLVRLIDLMQDKIAAPLERCQEILLQSEARDRVHSPEGPFEWCRLVSKCFEDSYLLQ